MILGKLRFLNSKVAFTLAEVLITLGVIGIVAAMTIPTLMSNYQKSQVLGQVKSTYAQLNNAIQMATAEYGTDINQWYVPDDTRANASTYFATTYLIPYIKTIGKCGTTVNADCTHRVQYLSNPSSYFYISGYNYGYSFIMANGTMVNLITDELNGSNVGNIRTWIFFDVNGKKPPNVMGKDAFHIELGGASWQSDIDKNRFWPYAWEMGYARSKYIDAGGGDTSGCNKTNGSGERCLGLIMFDGWQMKDDYPW